MFGLALHFLRDRPAAEEIAQDVFLALHKNLRSVSSDEHAKYWLRRVTVQRCIDHTRRRPAIEMPLEDAREIGVAPVENDVFVRERLRRLIGGLSPDARAVMILRYQEDLSPPEIAATLSMPVATVKSHLQRSLGVLREKMGVATTAGTPDPSLRSG
ncbi:sigma-24, ECF subfamily [Candidatus Koribacter versatilis Ellin345]|uniref:Sigma-24, ECF subfamily n=1 Tax=Koribacter versatilis (strain Ellin345) TaxID=204669 RepID=Q1IIA3_KORVE|nr:sigma-24, ECF subfamily [Candidatus Koribacter versatilis Ellin345]